MLCFLSSNKGEKDSGVFSQSPGTQQQRRRESEEAPDALSPPAGSSAPLSSPLHLAELQKSFHHPYQKDLSWGSAGYPSTPSPALPSEEALRCCWLCKHSGFVCSSISQGTAEGTSYCFCDGGRRGTLTTIQCSAFTVYESCPISWQYWGSQSVKGHNLWQVG